MGTMITIFVISIIITLSFALELRAGRSSVDLHHILRTPGQESPGPAFHRGHRGGAPQGSKGGGAGVSCSQTSTVPLLSFQGTICGPLPCE